MVVRVVEHPPSVFFEPLPLFIVGLGDSSTEHFIQSEAIDDDVVGKIRDDILLSLEISIGSLLFKAAS